MSDSSAQRVRVGPFAVSVDKQKPLIGAKTVSYTHLTLPTKRIV